MLLTTKDVAHLDCYPGFIRLNRIVEVSGKAEMSALAAFCIRSSSPFTGHLRYGKSPCRPLVRLASPSHD